MKRQSYSIRRAKPVDLAVLPHLERAAATRFRETPYANLVTGDLISAQIDLDHEYVWVVVDAEDRPVGFAIVSVSDSLAYLRELDIHPQHARQGLGRWLIETIVAWGREQDMTALTLITFSDIPWNAPYYERLGFYPLDKNELNSVLQNAWQEEMASGLPMKQRICMQIDL